MSKEQVISLLKTNTVLIDFMKTDGTIRSMTATLREDIIPPAEKADPLSQKKVRAINDAVQVVWDFDKEAWRSFRWENLQKVNGLAFNG